MPHEGEILPHEGENESGGIGGFRRPKLSIGKEGRVLSTNLVHIISNTYTNINDPLS